MPMLQSKLEGTVEGFFEGKFIVYEYSECDTEGEGTVANIFQIRQGKAQRVITPQQEYDPDNYHIGWVAEEIYAAIAAKVKATGQDTVYAPWHLDSCSFLGVKTGYRTMKYNKKGKIDEEWCELKSLSRSGGVGLHLADHGLTLLYYDVEIRTFQRFEE